MFYFRKNKSFKKIIVAFALFFAFCYSPSVFAGNLSQKANASVANGNDVPAATLTLKNATGETEVVSSLQLLFMMTLIALAPFLLLMLTCFPRILISLHFLRSALGTQQMPPNQILIGIALFLTLFLMGPIFTEINDTAIKPYSSGQISQETTLENAMKPLREFMFKEVQDEDMRLFIRLSGEDYKTPEEIPNRVLIPAFILGEMTKGFIIGFCIYVPFLVIDMIVASVLMAMGMMMLPPAMISLPFKLLLFIMVDGWSLIIETLVNTFH